MTKENHKLDVLSEALNCLYTANFGACSMMYPSDVTSTAATITGAASTNTWSSWTTILPAATIDGESEDHFYIRGLELSGTTTDTRIYIEFRYNGTQIGAGTLVTTGGFFFVSKDKQASFMITEKVSGNDLEMRVKADATDEDVTVGFIQWCSGNKEALPV